MRRLPPRHKAPHSSKGCPEVARKEKPPTSPQVRGLDGAVSRYSHSFTLVYCCVIPVDSSLVVGFDRLAAESRRMTSRRRLGQIRELFRNREPAVSFLSRGQKRVGFEAQNRPKRCQNGRFSSLLPV